MKLRDKIINDDPTGNDEFIELLEQNNIDCIDYKGQLIPMDMDINTIKELYSLIIPRENNRKTMN